MSWQVEILLVIVTLALITVQVVEDRKWRRLLRRLPRVRANIRQHIREELCLDCRVGEPHACAFMTEAEYAEILALEPARG